MHIALLKRRINDTPYAPLQYLRLNLELIECMAKLPNHHAVTTKQLESLKPFVMQFGYPNDIMRFANACKTLLHSGYAIQFLQSVIKNRHKSCEITPIGAYLAKLMIDHNEPVQSIINTCSKILSVNPTHIPTLEMLANSLKTANRPADAAIPCQKCFDLQMKIWETANLKTTFNTSNQADNSLKIAAQNATRTAVTLENLYTALHNIPMRCRTLQQHLRLDPANTDLLFEALKDMESSHAFNEMAAACLDF